jgi:hypothetical protein
MIFPALSIGFGLFIIGVLFAYYVVVPQALEYFHEYSANIGIVDNWRIGLYISFVTSFTLIFGLVFETPVVIMIMVKLGLLTSVTMRKSRGWAIVIMLVAAAVITPTGDMFSMSLMAGPMIIMYEICVWLAWLHERKLRRLEAEEQRQSQARRAALVGVAAVQTARPGSDPDAPSSDSDDNDGGGGSGVPSLDPSSGGDGGHSSPETESSGEHSGNVHPHHPDDGGADSVGDYEQYLRDHARMHSPSETHPESVPFEERHDHGYQPPQTINADGWVTQEPAQTEAVDEKPAESPVPSSEDPSAPTGSHPGDSGPSGEPAEGPPKNGPV